MATTKLVSALEAVPGSLIAQELIDLAEQRQALDQRARQTCQDRERLAGPGAREAAAQDREALAAAAIAGKPYPDAAFVAANTAALEEAGRRLAGEHLAVEQLDAKLVSIRRERGSQWSADLEDRRAAHALEAREALAQFREAIGRVQADRAALGWIATGQTSMAQPRTGLRTGSIGMSQGYTLDAVLGALEALLGSTWAEATEDAPVAADVEVEVGAGG